MAVQGPIPTIKDHKKVGDDIDEAYMACIAAATDVRTYLVRPVGNRVVVFLAFYEPFAGLFLHTRNLTEMKDADEEGVISSIDEWLDFTGIPTRRRMKYGLLLFEKYQKLILMNGVVIPTRQ